MFHSSSTYAACEYTENTFPFLDQGINQENKQLFQWEISEIQAFGSPMLLKILRGRLGLVRGSDMHVFTGDIPKMRLYSTAEYFINKLSKQDKALLNENLKALHGKCITIGTTCSGTDIIIPVLKWTFGTLGRIFGVSCRFDLHYSTNFGVHSKILVELNEYINHQKQLCTK